jgi:outer membrane protein
MKYISSIYRITGFGSLLLFLLQPQVNGQSLREVINLALDHSKLIAAQKAAVSESELNSIAASRSTLPKIDFDASYKHVTDRAELDFSKINPLSNAKIGLGVYDTYDTGITLSYPLFTGFALSNQVEMKNQQVSLADIQLEKTRKTIAFQTIAAYRGAQNYALEIESLKAAQSRIKLQLDRLKSAVNQGMALPVDTLSLALAKLSYDQKIISTRAEYETALQKLENYTGQKINLTEVQPSSDYNVAEMQFEQVDDLQMLQTQKALTKTGKALSEASYYPNVGLFASYKYSKPGVDFISDKWMTYGAWGISLNWNLFSWGSDKLKSEAQQVAVDKISNQYEAMKDDQKTKYDSAVREYKALKEQNTVVAASLELARKKMKIIDSQFKQGMSSATDFNVANLELTEAEIAQKRQQILISLKLNEIDFITGVSINNWSMEL